MVKVTLGTFDFRLLLLIVQTPLELVGQSPDPFVPLLQAPVTIAPSTGASLLSCTVIVTRAFQRLRDPLVLTALRSATCASTAGELPTVMVILSLPMAPSPSVMVAVMV